MTRAKQSVVVGVDGSESSSQAALWAAAARGVLHHPPCPVAVVPG
ncbi:hypothetical protein [Saccharopolyspora shandongensis]